MRIESLNALVVSNFHHAYDIGLDTRVNAMLKCHNRESKLRDQKVSSVRDRIVNFALLYPSTGTVRGP